MKKKLILALSLALVFVLGVMSVFALHTGAETPAPTLSIDFANLSFRDSITMKFAVKAENAANVKLLCFTEGNGTYEKGGESRVLSYAYTETISGTEYLIFDYTGLAAKQMTDVIYVRAYAEAGGKAYYSNVLKYSVLEYVYTMLGKIGNAATSNAELKTLLEDMLTYGASAQKYLNYRTDALATDAFYQVKVKDGLLSDGMTSGLFRQGSQVTVTAASEKDGIPFSHWADENGAKIAETASATVTVANANAVYTAVFEKKVTPTVYTRVDKDGTPNENGSYILFGEYPQSLKEAGVTVTTKTDARGYYLGSDGAYYAKVTATPYSYNYTFANGASVTRGQVYYFKVEPIRWRILSEKNGTAFILCDSIIANQAYDAEENNNYAQSDIRAWLNGTFYETAFDALEQELIQTVTVDNSAYSTEDDSNPYACENTQDKVFLLSYREVIDPAYGFSSGSGASDTARRMMLSDLARATGAWMSTATAYYGNGEWRLRSPDDNYSYDARAVYYDGYVINRYVTDASIGVVPALQIRLAPTTEPEEPSASAYTRVDKDGTPNENGSYILFGEYPQSLKADGVTVGAETDDRGYFLGSDGAYYAKVTATPYESGYTFANGASVTRGQVYYFKVEPIRWRILSEENGTAFILCDSIIANQVYDADRNNNYAQSDIRAWLNATFYETAFDALEQELIQTVTVDNSVYSTGYDSNPYACENTQDKVFLLSYREVIDPAYGFSSYEYGYDIARRMTVSDLARATGAWMDPSTSYYGNGNWWLRSPNDGYSYYARAVDNAGYVNYIISVSYDTFGVVPALQIRLR